MIIASRTLKLREATQARDVPVRIYAPERGGIDWMCRFEIDWPTGRAERWGAGVDAVQALVSALQMIGAELYASEAHRSGALCLDEPGRGYGFPVPNSIRDLLIGDDRKYL